MATVAPLITKYRPSSFEEVVGNEVSVAALQAAISDSSCPKAFLFSGPSGVGKTTLARIIASNFDAAIEEIDAASNSGVEAARQLIEAMSYQPIAADKRMVIIDECHNLTRNAWNVLLKPIEEPPSYLYIALATTELTKVPDAIRTRCYHCVLKPLKMREMDDFIQTICDLEGYTIRPEVYTGILQAATGQPRKALSILQAGHAAQSMADLAAVLAEVASEKSPLVDLVKYLLQSGRDWPRISKLLAEIIESEEDESMTQIGRYISNVIVQGATEEQARRAWKLLDALTFPRNGFDRKSQLIAAVGGYLWS